MQQSCANGYRSRIAALALAMLVAFALCLPATAYAEVRRADVIAGRTVEERGLTVAECPSVDASFAILVDKDGKVFFERDTQTPAQIASITKVMTAIVALDNAPDGLFVAVSEYAAEIGESSASLQAGDVMNLHTALQALLVPSGNDAAQAIAESVGSAIIAADPSKGSDPVLAFVNAMNEKATAIGCVDTYYENPHGLDDGVYEGRLHSTAADQAKVAQCAMQYPEIREIVASGDTVIQVDRGGSKVDVLLETTDELLDMYEYAIGIKTGYTNLAGASFMGAASMDGRELYAILLNSSDEQQRFQDAKNLFIWAYEHVIDLKLSNSSEYASMRGNPGQEVPVFAAVAHGDWIDRTIPATLAEPDASIQVFDFEGNISQSVTFDEIHGNVRSGDKVGSVVFKQRNQVVAEMNLVAVEDVPAPNPLDTIAIWWQRFIGGFSGEPATADSLVYNVLPIINNNKATAL